MKQLSRILIRMVAVGGFAVTFVAYGDARIMLPGNSSTTLDNGNREVGASSAHILGSLGSNVTDVATSNNGLLYTADSASRAIYEFDLAAGISQTVPDMGNPGPALGAIKGMVQR